MNSYLVLTLNGFTFFNNLISYFMNRITKTLVTLISFLSILTSSCKKDIADNPLTDQDNALANSKSVQPRLQERLVTGLEELQGSTVGPDKALYVTAPLAGTIWRINPKTGAATLFTTGLPK